MGFQDIVRDCSKYNGDIVRGCSLYGNSPDWHFLDIFCSVYTLDFFNAMSRGYLYNIEAFTKLWQK